MEDKKPTIWVDFLNDAAGREAIKPFIAAASAFSKEAGVVSGIVGAEVFSDMHGSALSALDGGLAGAFSDMHGSALSALDGELAGSKSKYYSRESVAGKDAELYLARALTLVAATVLCDGARAELQFPSRILKSRSVILNGAARADDSHHHYLTGRLSYDLIGDFENLLHAVSFHRDWNKAHHVYSGQVSRFAQSWNIPLHCEFMERLACSVGSEQVEKKMDELTRALRMVGFMHKSRGGNAAEAMAMKDGTFDSMIGIEPASRLLSTERRLAAEQIREVEELARQQVELEMNPMLSSW